MTTIHNKQINAVNYEEPQTKSPPLLSVGPLAWIKNNLFGSLMDTILTVVGAIVIVSAVTAFFTWALAGANWFVIIFNMRQFLIGRFEPWAEWRVQLLALLVIAVLGWAVGAWSRISRGVFIFLLVITALLFVLPPVIRAVVPLSPSFVSAGETAIAYGSVAQQPLAQLGFIGREGEVITLRVAREYSQNDRALANSFSFVDSPLNTLRNAAENRLTIEARIPEIERLLAGDALTPNQRALLTADLERLEVPPPVTETYHLNEFPAQVRLLDGATMEPISEALLSGESEPLSVTLPRDGWYVLEKTVPDNPEAVTLIAAEGIYPMLERSFTRSASIGPDGETIAAGRVTQYIRMTDIFLVEGGRPRIEGTDVPFENIVENQYRGARPLHDYLSLYLAPFFQQINTGFLWLLIAGIIGYWGARLTDKYFSPVEKPRLRSQRIAFWLFIALPPVAFILVAGFGILPPTSPPLWGGLLLTMLLTVVGIVVSFPLGVALALGRRSSLPVVKGASIAYIELVRGVPLITVLLMAMVLVPFVAPWLGGPDTGPYRAMVAVTLFSAAYLAENVRGGLQSLPPGQEEAAKALGLSAWQATLFITLPQALRAVIPALVGQFISLFKDTSLVTIVGLMDLTDVAQTVVNQNEFLGLRREAFVFISIVYFVFSYVMAMVSRRIEESGSGAARRI